MRMLLTLVMAVSVWILATAAAADPALSQQDRRGPVTVAVTLLPDDAGRPMRVKVVLDTHSVDLERINLPPDGVVMTVSAAAMISGTAPVTSAVSDSRQARATSRSSM